jgi:hypothetical protein
MSSRKASKGRIKRPLSKTYGSGSPKRPRPAISTAAPRPWTRRLPNSTGKRDPAAVARRIESIAGLDATDGNPVWSQKYRERFDAFYAEGGEKGINLSLEVAIELARRMLASARNSDEHGTAFILLGNALCALGERESGTARLEEAVAAYRAALEEYTRAERSRTSGPSAPAKNATGVN